MLFYITLMTNKEPTQEEYLGIRNPESQGSLDKEVRVKSLRFSGFLVSWLLVHEARSS